MKICHLSAEYAPLAKTGGLGDVAAGLCPALKAAGHDVRPFLPMYRTGNHEGLDLRAVEFMSAIPIQMGAHRYDVTAFSAELPSGLRIYLIHCPALFDRDGFYTSDWDEPLRFGVFCRAVIECCQRMGWAPDVFHCNDWHTSLLPLYLRFHYGWDRLFASSRTLLAIHNIGYQGAFPADRLHDLDFGGFVEQLHNDDLRAGVLNFLKNGLIWADALSTVSRTYAREIQTAEFGVGLHEMLRQRDDHLIGIVNGVDYGDWDPSTDPHLPFTYTSDDLDGKRKNTEALLNELGLSYDPRVPTIGIVSRLTSQKGFDLLFEAMPHLLNTRDLRFVVLGSGEAKYERWFAGLQEAFPSRVCFWRGYNNPLAHRIEASSDIFLMPSLYEPCGLNQMYSLRYGAVPIVRRTGGLADTVEQYDPVRNTGTGFVFDHYTARGLAWAIGQALDLYPHRDRWTALMRRGMAQDFSWAKQVKEYEVLYRAVMRLQRA